MGQRIIKHDVVMVVDFFVSYFTSAGSDNLTTTVGEKEIAVRIKPFFREYLREFAQRKVSRDDADAFAIG